MPLALAFVRGYGRRSAVIGELCRRLEVPQGWAGVWWRVRTNFADRRKVRRRLGELRALVQGSWGVDRASGRRRPTRVQEAGAPGAGWVSFALREGAWVGVEDGNCTSGFLGRVRKIEPSHVFELPGLVGCSWLRSAGFSAGGFAAHGSVQAEERAASQFDEVSTLGSWAHGSVRQWEHSAMRGGRAGGTGLQS